MSTDTPPPGDFHGFFELERVGDDRYRAHFPVRDEWDLASSLFGGSILGFATAAAAETCPDRPLASLHMYFLRGVPYGESVDFVVERVRDGRRVAHRQVDVVAQDRLASRIVLLYAAGEPGQPELFGRRDMSGLAAPESLPAYNDVVSSEGEEPWWDSPIEWRFEGRPWEASVDGESRHGGWVRPFLALPDRPGRHAAATVFLSDALSHWPVARLLGGRNDPGSYTSLDTAVWLHRDEPWTDWRYIESECDVGHGGRGFSRRCLYARDGRLLATMVQEALIPGAPPGAGGAAG